MPRRTLQPLLDVKAFWSIERYGIFVKKVWHDSKIPVGGELISDAGSCISNRSSSLAGAANLQLRVDELMPNDIREDQDGVRGRLVFWIADVGIV